MFQIQFEVHHPGRSLVKLSFGSCPYRACVLHLWSFACPLTWRRALSNLIPHCLSKHSKQAIRPSVSQRPRMIQVTCKAQRPSCLSSRASASSQLNKTFRFDSNLCHKVVVQHCFELGGRVNVASRSLSVETRRWFLFCIGCTTSLLVKDVSFRASVLSEKFCCSRQGEHDD